MFRLKLTVDNLRSYTFNRLLKSPINKGGNVPRNMFCLRLDSPEDCCDRLTALLALDAPYGWQEEPLVRGTRFTLYSESRDLLMALAARSREACPDCGAEIVETEIPDPLEAWKEFFTPVVCGSRFVILPPWLARETFPQPCRIIIEPKSAFGTGHHASTRLCLTALDFLLDRGECGPGDTFLDLGCGAGTLGLGCAMAGMKGRGLDIDPVAIENALENRVLNKVSDLDLECAGSESLTPGEYNLILANILAGPLIEMAEDVARALAPGGRLILSGILKTQAWKTAGAYEKAGLHWLYSAADGEWAVLMLGRP